MDNTQTPRKGKRYGTIGPRDVTPIHCEKFRHRHITSSDLSFRHFTRFIGYQETGPGGEVLRLGTCKWCGTTLARVATGPDLEWFLVHFKARRAS